MQKTIVSPFEYGLMQAVNEQKPGTFDLDKYHEETEGEKNERVENHLREQFSKIRVLEHSNKTPAYE